MISIRIRARISQSLFLLACSFFAPSIHADLLLRFGVYASDKPTAMVRQFRPALKALEKGLSKKLGESVKMRLKVAHSYEQGVANLVNGDVDLARLGPASYVLAKKENPGIRILALEAKDGEKVSNGVICVNEGSGITEVEQLRGKRFAFGSERSTIGRYLAQQLLIQHGIKSGNLAHYEYLGRHDRVAAAVAAGDFDAGAVKESTFHNQAEQGSPIKAIATFPNVANPWVGRADLDDRIARAIIEVLLELDDEGTFKALEKNGFVTGSDADYANIRDAMNVSRAFVE